MFNPHDSVKNLVMADSYYEPRSRTISSTSDSFWPDFDWSDPIQVAEKSVKIRMLLGEIRKLSKMERTLLMAAIFNIP